MVSVKRVLRWLDHGLPCHRTSQAKDRIQAFRSHDRPYNQACVLFETSPTQSQYVNALAVAMQTGLVTVVVAVVDMIAFLASVSSATF